MYMYKPCSQAWLPLGWKFCYITLARWCHEPSNVKTCWRKGLGTKLNKATMPLCRYVYPPIPLGRRLMALVVPWLGLCTFRPSLRLLGDQAWEHGWVNLQYCWYTLNYIHRMHACTYMYMCTCSIQQAYTCTCTVVHTTSTFSPLPLLLTPTHHTNRWWETADVMLWLPLLLVLYSGTAHCMYMYIKLFCTWGTMYRYKGAYTHT